MPFLPAHSTGNRHSSYAKSCLQTQWNFHFVFHLFLSIALLKCFISFLSSSNFSAAHRVCTFHVHTVLLWSFSREREPCFTRRRPSRYEFSLKLLMIGFFRVFVFTDGGSCFPSI